MKSSSRALLMWSVVSLLMVLHFFLLLSVGVITTELRDALDVSALELSFLSSSYLYVYLVLQTPAGVLIDHFGARKLLTIGSIVNAVGCWMFSHSETLQIAMLARILMGGGLAFVFISSIQLAGRWFAPRYFGLMIGLSEASGMVGAIVGNMLLAMFIHIVGWRDGFTLAAAISLVLGALTWLWVRDFPDNYKVVKESELSVAKVLTNLNIITRKPQIWLHTFYIALMYVSVTVFSGLWANPYLQRVFALSLQESTFACCLVLAGIGIGSPIAGILCHTKQSQDKCIVWCAVFSLIIFCMLLYIPFLTTLSIYLLMFALGVGGSSLILSLAIVSNMAPEGAKSTSVGLVNSLSLISAIIFQPVIGWTLNVLAGASGADEFELFTATHYRIALSVLPVLIVLALGVALVIAKQDRDVAVAASG